MSDLDALLAGIVAHPHEAVRWLILADWLDDHGFADRAELLRLHRELIRTCCEPDAHPERAAWQARIVELIDRGVTPCVPQHTLMLPGGVPLVGNFIPPGSFLMGNKFGADNEQPVHPVTLTNGMFLGEYPVTQVQWRAVTDTDPSCFKDGKRPAETVSWNDASAWCARATEFTGHPVRLPTEAEWEYACRAGSSTGFYYGGVPSTERMVCGRSVRVVEIKPGSPEPEPPLHEPELKSEVVGSRPPNAWGVFDLHGNVWEWCADHHDRRAYGSQPRVDPIVRASKFVSCSLRGGSWNSELWQCGSANRWRLNAGGRYDFVGFRVAFTLN